MNQLWRGIGLTCALLAGSVWGAEPDIQAQFKTDYREQGFEQFLASSVHDRDRLPPEGTLTSNYLTLVSDAIQPRNGFKFVSWVLCVSPTREPDGTVLIIDSVQHTQASETSPRSLEILYRRVKTPGQHTTNQVWPYALLMARGLFEHVTCRAIPG